jgi:hypothetical protein
VFLSAREAAERAGVNKDTANKYLSVALVERGFIDLVTPSGFSRKDRMAAEYRLTTFPCDKTGIRASNRFRDWRPESPENGPKRGL